jgi:hypothetical protein
VFDGIAQKLQQLRDLGITITEVAFIDHGADGFQSIDEDEGLVSAINAEQMQRLRNIGGFIDPTGKISLYGCNSGRDSGALQSWADAFGRRVEGQTGALQCFPWGGCRRAGDIVGANPGGH